MFNRCEDLKPLPGYRRSVKVVSPQAEVIFEDEEGEIENIFEDDVPYDLKAIRQSALQMTRGKDK